MKGKVPQGDAGKAPYGAERGKPIRGSGKGDAPGTGRVKSKRGAEQGKESSFKKSKTGPRGPSQRQLRVGEELRHLLAEILMRTEFHDKELVGAKLTISEVRVSPDLKHATIFLTRLGNKDVAPLLPALKRVSPYLRAQIAPRIGLRVTPDLKFMADEALDEAGRINALLHAPEVARDLD